MDRLTKAFVTVAAVGIPDALYHAYDEITAYTGLGTQYCNTHLSFWGFFISCTDVFQSGYRKFLGVEMWVYGVVWFPLILGLALWFVHRNGSLNGEVLLPLLMVGNVFTLYLWYLELGVIHAICPVCVSMYALNYAMTALVGKALLKE